MRFPQEVRSATPPACNPSKLPDLCARTPSTYSKHAWFAPVNQEIPYFDCFNSLSADVISGDDFTPDQGGGQGDQLESYGMVQMSTEPSDVSCRSSKLYFRQAATHVRARSPHVCQSL
jgi:hypothetical protein